MNDDDALAIIDTVVKEGAVLNIYEDDDLRYLSRLTFLRLQHEITEKQASQIGDVLSNTNILAADRLNFIDSHIL